ncbi:MAG: type II toxin-antitoxin system RelE/ParE family toxin [Planctomycetes bacterium]|nr:type II toxin-antitoxin system RelE/ParE family toxin [Planctomycetota bacterium]
MSARFTVHWTPEAEDDAATIVDYFDDPINAEKVIVQFGERADSLQTFPERGRVVPELRSIGVLDYREVFHKPWRMVYAIKGKEVWIMAVLDGRRALTDLLFERLTR